VNRRSSTRRTGFCGTDNPIGIISGVIAPASDSRRPLGIRAELSGEGGPKTRAEFMDELRENHLGIKPRHRSASDCRRRISASSRESNWQK
jgi:hypothetical protein